MSRSPSRSARAGARGVASSPAVAGFRPAVVALAAALAIQAHAQTAVHGTASLHQDGNKLTVTTTNGAGHRSVINWQAFGVAAGATTHFAQPDALSTSINRVTGNTRSDILGTLSSNGRLVLVNPSGIAFGANASVDTAGFTASALGLSEADAIAGRLLFQGGANKITVEGGAKILANGGDIVLVGSQVQVERNAVLESNGATILAAGEKVEITGRGLEGIRMEMQAGNEAVNLGELKGDAVGIFARTLKHSGIIQANALTTEGGRVVLKAVGGDALVDGSITAKGNGGKGGAIDVLGQRVGLLAGATLDASGANGGGSIRVGGDYQGANPDVQNAKAVYVDAGARILADATVRGDGGRVIVWSDDMTRMHGRISARGGEQGGNGGFAEVSGKKYLEYTGLADLRAPKGEMGTLLLDPQDVTIIDGPSGASTGTFPITEAPGTKFEPTNSNGAVTLTDGHLNDQLALGHVIVKTDSDVDDGADAGQITVAADADVNWTSGTDLKLLADKGITIDGMIRGTGAGSGLVLEALDGDITDGAASRIEVEDLYATATGGSVVLDKGHYVTRIAGTAATAGSSFVFNGAQTYEVGEVITAWGGGSGVSSGTVSLVSQQDLRVTKAVTAAGLIQVTARSLEVTGNGVLRRTGSGDIELSVDGLSLAGASGNAIESTSGRVVINPLAATAGVAILGTDGVAIDTGLNLLQGDLNKIAATTLVVGNGSLPMDITLSGDIDLTSVQALSLISGRNITQEGGTLKVAAVNLDGDYVHVDNAGNQVGTVSGRYTQEFRFASDISLTVATVDGIAGVKMRTPVPTPSPSPPPVRDLAISSLGQLNVNADVNGMQVALTGSTVQAANGVQIRALGGSAGLNVTATGTGASNLGGATLYSEATTTLTMGGTTTLGNITTQDLYLNGGDGASEYKQAADKAIQANRLEMDITTSGSKVDLLNSGNEINEVAGQIAGTARIATLGDMTLGSLQAENLKLMAANLRAASDTYVDVDGNTEIKVTGDVDLSNTDNELGYVHGTIGGNATLHGVAGVAAAGLSAGGDITLVGVEPILTLVPPTEPTDLDVQGNVTAAGSVTLSSSTQILVQAGAEVSGTTLQLDAPLTSVYGKLLPGGRGGIGSVTATGDLAFLEGGTMEMDVASTSSFDTLYVMGAATTDSASAIHVKDLTGNTLAGSFRPTTLGPGSSLAFSLPTAWSVSAGQPYEITAAVAPTPVASPPPPPAAPPPGTPVVEEAKQETNNTLTTFLELFEQEVARQEDDKDRIGKDDIVLTDTACTR